MYLVELPHNLLIKRDGYLIRFYIEFIAQGLSAPFINLQGLVSLAHIRIKDHQPLIGILKKRTNPDGLG